MNLMFGEGDIFATTGGERVSLSHVHIFPRHEYHDDGEFSQIFCIFLFLCAASLFGTIIAQVNEIVADLTTKKKDLDRILESYLTLNPRLLLRERHLCMLKFIQMQI
jgi:hypothetical protein